jgi:hypothetical protein
MPPFEDYNDVKYPIDEEALVIRRLFKVLIKDDDVEYQIENIFHTICHMSNNVCSMITDSMSCANIANIALIRK